MRALVVGLIAVLVAAGCVAGAREAYLSRLASQYGYARGTGGVAVQLGCDYCHVSPEGGGPWNAFGQSVAASYFGVARGRISEALYLVLAENADADGDGYRDALEVVAGTRPGDARSRPSERAAVLESRLAARGGVASFRASGPEACSPTENAFDEPLPSLPSRALVGTGHVLTGVVRTEGSCAPVPGARVVFWLANERGEYDDAHRGGLVVDASGRYRIESSFPGVTGPPPHIHVGASAPGHRDVNALYYPRAGQKQGEFDLILKRQP
jgi:hypothetical protein